MKLAETKNGKREGILGNENFFLYLTSISQLFLTNLTTFELLFNLDLKEKMKKTWVTYLTRLNKSSNDISLILESYPSYYISLKK
jgi:hypothetical protein